MKILAIAFAAFSLAACATAPASRSGPMPTEPEEPGPGAPSADAEQEAIYSAGLGREGLTVRVNSNGCTKLADFRVQVLDGYPAPTVILHRVQPDNCRSLVAGGVDLLFSWTKLKLPKSSPIVLANPLTADPTPGR